MAQSRYEQRKSEGIQYEMKRLGIPFNPDCAQVKIEDTGYPSDMLRQEAIMYKEGYDRIGTAPDIGIFLEIPRDEIKKNEKRYHDEADARLAATPEIDARKDGAKVTSNTVSIGEKQSAAEFLESGGAVIDE